MSKFQFLHMLPVAMTGSFSFNNASCFVLWVLWMTPCFHIIEHRQPLVECINICQTIFFFMFGQIRQVAALERSLMSTIVLFEHECWYSE